jgi:hypothetical protein
MKGGANVEKVNQEISLSQNEGVPYEYTFILAIWLRTAGGKMQFINACPDIGFLTGKCKTIAIVFEN